MVQVDDLVKMTETEEPHKAEKPTLLSKYQIPVQHIEYEYIENCKDGRELEKILHILKSGEEGYFPDLIRTTEKRLAEIKPNSKLLRKLHPVLNKTEISQDEWYNLSKDLEDWVADVNKKDQELEDRKIKSDAHLTDFDVRRTKDGCIETQAKANPKRIASTDYESWDKYDPDTEILKMDLEDEKLKKKALKEHKANPKKSKTVRFNNFATEAEALFEANREKERGNECFKAGELQTALQHYTNSLECKPLPAVYTNRALILNKLKKYKKAIDDCNAALKLEPRNFKAHLRMAQNYDALEQYDEALESVENAIEIDPNNAVAQQLANHVREVCGKTNLKTRFMIQDVESASTPNEVKPVFENITNKNEIEAQQSKEGNNCINEGTKSKNMKPSSQDVVSVNNSSVKPLKSILKNNKTNDVAAQNKQVCEDSIKLAIQDVKSSNAKPTKSILKGVRSHQSVEKSKNKETTANNKNFEVIAIPGTSTMPPPYYKVVYSRDPEIIKREKQKILYRPMLLHITTIDVTSDDEFQKDDYSESIQKICPQNYEEKKTKRSATIKIKDDFDNFQLENFKFNDDEETTKDKHKSIWNNICRQNTTQEKNTENMEINNKGAGGEPYNCDQQQFLVPTMEELQSPYVFIETWNSIRKDTSYKHHAEILKKLDFNIIHNVIGFKLDDTMLSIIINCLHKHFMVPGELDRLQSALTNITRIPRFKMMSMFLEESDWRCIYQLIQFLDQHGRNLANDIRNIYFNN